MKKSLLLNNNGSMARVGIDLGISAIFILAIGLVITVEVINDLTTAPVNGTAPVTGITATVSDFAPLIVVAGFIFFVAKIFGMI